MKINVCDVIENAIAATLISQHCDGDELGENQAQSNHTLI